MVGDLIVFKSSNPQIEKMFKKILFENLKI